MYYVCCILPVCLPEGQKRASDLLMDDFEPPFDCWVVNSEPVLLTTDPSLQPRAQQ